MYMIEFWSRVEHQRKSLGLTQREVSLRCGFPERKIETWLSRKIQSIPKANECVAIASALGTTVEYLVTGEELALPDDDFVIETPKNLLSPSGKELITVDEDPTVLVPVYSQKISAGPGEEFLASDIIGRIRVPERMTRGLDISQLGAAEVVGDSMTGIQLYPGDIVIFAGGMVKENGVYVLSVNNEVRVKRLEFDPFNNKLVIKSENKRYDPIVVPADCNNVVIKGMVIGWFHFNHYY